MSNTTQLFQYLNNMQTLYNDVTLVNYIIYKTNENTSKAFASTHYLLTHYLNQSCIIWPELTLRKHTVINELIVS